MEKIELKLRKGVLISVGIAFIGPFLFFILFSVYLKIFKNDSFLTLNLLSFVIISFVMAVWLFCFYLPNTLICVDRSGVKVA